MVEDERKFVISPGLPRDKEYTGPPVDSWKQYLTEDRCAIVEMSKQLARTSVLVGPYPPQPVAIVGHDPRRQSFTYLSEALILSFTPSALFYEVHPTRLVYDVAPDKHTLDFWGTRDRQPHDWAIIRMKRGR